MTWSSQVGTLTGPQLENYSTLTLVPRTQVSSEARGDLVRKSRAGLLLLWFPAGEITGHFHQSISLQQHIPGPEYVVVERQDVDPSLSSINFLQS